MHSAESSSAYPEKTPHQGQLFNPDSLRSQSSAFTAEVFASAAQEQARETGRIATIASSPTEELTQVQPSAEDTAKHPNASKWGAAALNGLSFSFESGMWPANRKEVSEAHYMYNTKKHLGSVTASIKSLQSGVYEIGDDGKSRLRVNGSLSHLHRGTRRSIKKDEKRYAKLLKWRHHAKDRLEGRDKASAEDHDFPIHVIPNQINSDLQRSEGLRTSPGGSGDEEAERAEFAKYEAILELFDYSDAGPSAIGAKLSKRELTESDTAMDYAVALANLIDDNGDKIGPVTSMAGHMVDLAVKRLGRINVEPTGHVYSRSWAYWNIARQAYANQYPDEDTDPETGQPFGDNRSNPLDDDKAANKARSDMVFHQVGLQASFAYVRNELDEDALPVSAKEVFKKFDQIIAHNRYYPNNPNQLSYEDLVKLGRAIKPAKASA